MEEITITNIEQNPTMSGKSRWKAVDNLGREFDVWSSTISEIITKNLNKLATVTIQVSEDGRYNSIQTFEPITGELEHAQEVVKDIPKVAENWNPPRHKPRKEMYPNEEKKPLLSAMEEKNLSIISQVMVKCANEYACTYPSENYGENLTMAINELTGAYHLAFNNLQTGK